MTGKKPYKNQSAYCASKFAIVGFSKVLAVEAQECRNCYFSSENKTLKNRYWVSDLKTVPNPARVAIVSIFELLLPRPSQHCIS